MALGQRGTPPLTLGNPGPDYSVTEINTHRRQLELLFKNIVSRLISLETLPTQLPTYSLATLPAVGTGQIAFVSDGRKTGEGGGSGTGVVAYSDGVAWRRVDDGSTVAA